MWNAGKTLCLTDISSDFYEVLQSDEQVVDCCCCYTEEEEREQEADQSTDNLHQSCRDSPTCCKKTQTSQEINLCC